jgi:hypothetical protein
VIIQVLQRGGLGGGQWVTSMPLLREHLRTQATGARDYRSVAPMLWDGLERRVPSAHKIEPLKAKFMLRQFVDEIKTSAHRETLIYMAYDATQHGPDAPSEELVKQAYKHLYRVLKRYEPSLGLMTAGALSPKVLEEAESTPLFFDELFLNTFDDTEEVH